MKPSVIVTNHDMQTQMEAAGLTTTQTTMLTVEYFDNALCDFCDNPEDAIAFLQHSSDTTGLKKVSRFHMTLKQNILWPMGSH